MEELTHTLLENGTIHKKDDCYFLSRKPSDIQIPDTVQGIIAARMDRLEESLKRIMQVASVIGREFAFRLLQSITDMREGLKTHLLNLQGLELIYEKRLFPELEYVFKHALTQEVAYNSLLLARRKEIHGRIGSAIEQLYPDRLEEFYEMLAYHYARGRRPRESLQVPCPVRQQATRLHSPREAFGFYSQALATLRQMPESEKRKTQELDALVLAATPLLLLGFPEGSLDMLQGGELLAKELRDSRHLAFFYGRLSSYHTMKGNPLLAFKYSEEALKEARKVEDIDLIVPIAQGLLLPYFGTGQSEKLVGLASGVLDLIEKTNRASEFFGIAANPYAYFSGLCGFSMGTLGNFQEGELFL